MEPILTQTAPDLGVLPEWRLDHLYAGVESPEFVADRERAAAQAKAFAGAYKRRLAALLDEGGDALAKPVGEYEALQDLMGRLMAFASLTYAGDTTDGAKAKFYGDAGQKITDIAGDLLFFELEINRLDDAALDAAMASGALAHYKPWLADIRKEKPHQLDDRIEQLFLEKSVSGASAWNRLYDETLAALRFDIEGESLTLEPALAAPVRARGAAPRRRRQGARQDLRREPAAVHAGHQHAGQGQGNLRPLAPVRRHRRQPPSGEPRRARGGRRPHGGGDGELSAPVASLLRAQSPLVRQGQAGALGPQRPAARRPPARDRVGIGARNDPGRLRRLFAAHVRHRAPLLRRGLDRRRRAPRQTLGRLRASDLAERASLRARQLHGQAARRDDAGA